MNKVRPGCKLTYQGNVLYCNHKRTFAENAEVCKVALIALLGGNPFRKHGSTNKSDFETKGGKLESYTVH